MENFIGLLFLLVAINANAQKTKYNEIWIQDEIRSSMEENNIPSLSIAVIENGDISFQAGFGKLSRDKGARVDENTVFQIASLSKMLTGIIAKSMVLEGTLDPEEYILEYLPAEKLDEKARNQIKSVKLKHLIHHASGIPRNSEVIERVDGDPMLGGYTEDDLLEDLHKIELDFEPGSKYSYSNLGYALLGYIMENCSGESYDWLLQKYLTKKFNLQNTFANSGMFSNSQLATPYRKDNRNVKTKPWETGKFVAASGIFSSVSDLAKLMKSQIEAYSLDQHEELILNSLKFSRKAPGRFYGFGIFEDYTSKGVFLSHRGDMDGYASEYGFFPELKVGVVILSSSGGDWSGDLVGKILKRLSDTAAESR